MKQYPICLTISGLDPSGGAGQQADIKTITATGSYAASVATAIVPQNTMGVREVFPIPPRIIASQLEALFDDIKLNAVKIGMLYNSEIIRIVRENLEKYEAPNIVLDPVMVATSGGKFLEKDAVDSLKTELIPLSTIITPNIPEAEILSEMKITSEDDMKKAALKLSCSGKISVMMKSGHMKSDKIVDILYSAEEDKFIELRSKRIDTPNTHGTGCTFSAAIASYLAQGMSLELASKAAKDYLSMAIESGAEFRLGRGGYGPVNHTWSIKSP